MERNVLKFQEVSASFNRHLRVRRLELPSNLTGHGRDLCTSRIRVDWKGVTHTGRNKEGHKGNHLNGGDERHHEGQGVSSASVETKGAVEDTKVNDSLHR